MRALGTWEWRGKKETNPKDVFYCTLTPHVRHIPQASQLQERANLDVGSSVGSCSRHLFMEEEEAVSLLTNPHWAKSFTRQLMERTRCWFSWNHRTSEHQLPCFGESDTISPLSLISLLGGQLWEGWQVYLPQVRYLLLKSAKNAISCQSPPQRKRVLSCGLLGKCTRVGE